MCDSGEEIRLVPKRYEEVVCCHAGAECGAVRRLLGFNNLWNVDGLVNDDRLWLWNGNGLSIEAH